MKTILYDETGKTIKTIEGIIDIHELVEVNQVDSEHYTDLRGNVCTFYCINDGEYGIKHIHKEVNLYKQDILERKVQGYEGHTTYNYTPKHYLNCLKGGTKITKNHVKAQEHAQKLINLFRHKGLNDVIFQNNDEVYFGSSMVTFPLTLGMDTNYKQIENLKDNIQLLLGVESVFTNIRNGKVEVTVPKDKKDIVYFKDIIESKKYERYKSPLKIALGMNKYGDNVIIDIKCMPHMLVAGQTRSGKSTGLHTIINSLLINNTPQTLKLVLIDFKNAEFIFYHDNPYLYAPVAIEPPEALKTLKMVKDELNKRKTLLSNQGVQNIDQYKGDMPHMVVMIDEFQMMIFDSESKSSANSFLKEIIPQSASCGIHFILSTQTPKATVIDSIIKNNLSCQMCFKVKDNTQSHVVIDEGGAEDLIPMIGDMLLKDSNMNNLDRIERVQCAYLSKEEIISLNEYYKTLGTPEYETHEEEIIEDLHVDYSKNEIDEGLDERVKHVIRTQRCVADGVEGLKQVFGGNYTTNKNYVNQMIDYGVVSDDKEVLMKSINEWEEKKREILK